MKCDHALLLPHKLTGYAQAQSAVIFLAAGGIRSVKAVENFILMLIRHTDSVVNDADTHVSGGRICTWGALP